MEICTQLPKSICTPKDGATRHNWDRTTESLVDQASATWRRHEQPLRGRKVAVGLAAKWPANSRVQRQDTRGVPKYKFAQQAHLVTLHGGVVLAMAKVREAYWVPRLCHLVKRARRNCWGCKRFRAHAYQSPPPGNLPSTRMQGCRPFQVIGVDFLGPICYQSKAKTESKAYLALYGCSLTRAVHLDLLKSLEASST